MRWIGLFCGVFVRLALVSASPAVAAAAAVNPGITLMAPDARIERLANGLAGERTARAAEQALLRFSRDRDENVRAAAAAILSAYYRSIGRSVEAAALVRAWAEMRPENLLPNRFEAFLEHARGEILSGHPMAAYRMLDYARENVRGLGAVLVRIAYADVVEQAPDYDKAMAWLREAIEHGDRWARPFRESESEPALPPPPGAERWPPLRAVLLSRVEALRFLATAEAWGRDYAHYLYAQNARHADHPLARDLSDIARLYPGAEPRRALIPGADYVKALEHYEQLIAEAPETVFAEAARLYRVFCLVRMDRSAEAERDLENFVVSAPLGLYRGEAWLTLGDLMLQERWNPEAAGRCYARALAWCERAEAVREGTRLYAVTEKAQTPAQAPHAWQTMAPSGVITRASIPPGAVVNRLTAHWYLNWLRSELCFRMGFLASLAGDWNAAIEDWQRVASHDPLLDQAQRQRHFNTLRRLKVASANRFLIGRDEGNQRISNRLKPAVWWADFLHMREQFEASESLYQRLYRAAGDRNDGVVAARAALGIMLRYHGESGRRAGQADQMLARGRAIGHEVLSRFPRAPAAPYVAFMIAFSTPCGNDRGAAEAAEGFRRLRELYPGSRHVAEARFWEIFLTLNHRTLEQHLPAIEQFRRDYAKSSWVKHLDDEVEFLRRRLEPSGADPITSGRGPT